MIKTSFFFYLRTFRYFKKDVKIFNDLCLILNPNILTFARSKFYAITCYKAIDVYTPMDEI